MGSGFANYLRGDLVIAHGDEGAVAEFVAIGPLDEGDLADELGVGPAAFFHLLGSEGFAPAGAFLLGEIDERASGGPCRVMREGSAAIGTNVRFSTGID